jgi:hypothetical protein
LKGDYYRRAEQNEGAENPHEGAGGNWSLSWDHPKAGVLPPCEIRGRSAKQRIAARAVVTISPAKR